ncbi:hypothetical protein [uncultured Brevundimonas sp.]|uniref:hypothetical protein n=1 Tax=uncultured Brevundimonas sp. TaxID=213418 RepID=UPI0030EC229D|tara:strand:+ start:11167 stop:11676 length:510 start_codon:yes stop_codon:yes gene_type:complete
MFLPVVFLAAWLLAAPAASPVVAPGVAAFQDACLTSTPMARADLAAMAERRGWVPVRARTPAELEWRDLYRGGNALIRLDQHKKTADNAGELICVVLVGPAVAGWKDQVSSLLANGVAVGPPGVYDTNVYQMPPELELTVWDLPDGSRIHALREPDNTLELSINYPTGR